MLGICSFSVFFDFQRGQEFYDIAKGPERGFLISGRFEIGDFDDDVKVTSWKSTLFNPEFGVEFRVRWDFDTNFSTQGVKGDFRAEDRSPRRECASVGEIGTDDTVVRVFFKTDMEEEVARRAALDAG